MEVIDFNLRNCAEEALKTFASLADEKGWSFSVTSHPMCRNW